MQIAIYNDFVTRFVEIGKPTIILIAKKTVYTYLNLKNHHNYL